MGQRATAFWLVFAAFGTALIAALTFILVWQGNPSYHLAVLIITAVVVVAILALVAFFARSWLVTVFRGLRSRGQTVWRSILNSARLSFATRIGRSVLGSVGLVAAIAGASVSVTAIQQRRLQEAVVPAIVMGVGGLLNGLAVAAGGNVHISVTPSRPLAKWERAFTIEDEVGPSIDFTEQQHVVFRVKPQANQWRFGLKFSASDEFATDRFGNGHALWNLQKDANHDALAASYNDGFSRGHGTDVMETYHDAEVTISIDAARPNLTVAVEGSPGYRHTFDLHDHRYALPTAWADGHGFSVKVEFEAG